MDAQFQDLLRLTSNAASIEPNGFVTSFDVAPSLSTAQRTQLLERASKVLLSKPNGGGQLHQRVADALAESCVMGLERDRDVCCSPVAAQVMQALRSEIHEFSTLSSWSLKPHGCMQATQ